MLGYTFRGLPSRINSLSYDDAAGTITFNGDQQKALAMGTARFAWIEVWDGEPASTHASYSYTVDLLHPDSPVSR